MANITTERYDPARIERIRHFLESYAEKGKPRFYEVFVDNLKAVDKTDDPAAFDEFKMYVDDKTQLIKILIYTSTEHCPRNDKFIFTVRDPLQEKQQHELNGLEVESKIHSAIEQERGRSQLLQLQKELEETKASLEESEEYSEQLETKLAACQQEFEEYRKRRLNLSEMKTGKLLGFATDYFVKNYPGLADKIPVIGALSGLLQEEEVNDSLSGPEDQSRQESHASFTKQKETGTTNQLDEETKAKLDFFRQMENSFSEDQIEKVIQIVQALMATPEKVGTIHELIFS